MPSEIFKSRGLDARLVEFSIEEVKLSDKDELLKEHAKYRRLVGKIIYLTITQTDKTNAHSLSRFMHEPHNLTLMSPFELSGILNLLQVRVYFSNHRTN